MKLTTVVLALFSSVTLAAPAAQMDKRAVVDATVAVDGLRYRTCPKTTCSAPGQYPKGTKIKLSCYTTSGTTEVDGDKRWAKVSGGVGNGRWVSLAYMDWPGTISGC